MQSLLSVVGSVLGLGGILMCLVSGVMRLGGDYHLAGFEVSSLLQLGIALLAAACWAKLESLERLP